MVRRSILLVHSPLVGPSSLRRLATLAAHAGHETALPDLTSIASSERPHAELVRLAADAARALAAPIVVGHSGAGVFLPAIGAAVDGAAGLVFVDAVVPPPSEPHRTSGDLSALLDAQTVDGVLRPWLDWWPSDVLDRILPDHADRDELRADQPRLPRSFYDVDVDVPAGWSDGPCAYLRLSPAYDADLADVSARGWPTASIDSTHLAAHTEPDRVLAELLALADRIA